MFLISIRLLTIITIERIDSLNSITDYTVRNYEINVMQYFQLTAIFLQYINLRTKYDPPVVSKTFFDNELGKLKNLTNYLDLHIMTFVTEKGFLEGNICGHIAFLPQELMSDCLKDTQGLVLMNRNTLYSSIVFDLRALSTLQANNSIVSLITHNQFNPEKQLFYLEQFNGPFIASMVKTCQELALEVTALSWKADLLAVILVSLSALAYVLYAHSEQIRRLFLLRSVILLLPEQLVSLNPYISSLIPQR